jgi:uncharacterized membrane protein YqjE
MANGANTTNDEVRTSGDIARDILNSAGELIRSEIRLATVELKTEAKQAGKAGGLFAASGILAFFGAAAWVAMCIILLAMALPLWFAAFIMGVILFGAASIFVLAAKQKWNQVQPPAATLTTLKEDAEWLKHRTI